MKRYPVVMVVLLVVGAGCKGELSGAADPRIDVTGEEVPETKRVRRMTADQFFDSLEVATGQRWNEAEDFAATLGRPDFQSVTTEGRELSMGFAKLAGDAARETCREAVERDLEGSTPTAERAILRRIDNTSPLDPFDMQVGLNLRYLALRFHGVYLTDDEDVRLQPWFSLLRNGLTATDDGRFDQAVERWTAVCVGMALHPDFLTY